MPTIDNRIELHAGIAALPSGLGNGLQQILCLVAVSRLSGNHGLGPPVAILAHGQHEFVGGAYGVVGILEKDGAVGVAVQRRVVAGVDECVRFLFFLGFAPNKLLDIRVIRVEN